MRRKDTHGGWQAIIPSSPVRLSQVAGEWVVMAISNRKAEDILERDFIKQHLMLDN